MSLPYQFRTVRVSDVGLASKIGCGGASAVFDSQSSTSACSASEESATASLAARDFTA